VALHQVEHGHQFVLWLDNPIFWDAGLGILVSLGHQVALGIVRADNLDDQISASPIVGLAAWVTAGS
jgi:hypothetical protein